MTKPHVPPTPAALAEFLTRQLPMTYDVFDKNRADDGTVNQASWARGRIDGLLQIMDLLDPDRTEMLRAEWKRVVSGEGFMSADGD